MVKSFDTIVIIVTTSSSTTLFLTGIGCIVIPISSAVSSGLSISKNILHEKVMENYNQDKKQYEKDQQTTIFFDKLYRKSLQGNLNDKIEYDYLSNVYTEFSDKIKNESFL